MQGKGKEKTGPKAQNHQGKMREGTTLLWNDDLYPISPKLLFHSAMERNFQAKNPQIDLVCKK